MPPENGTIILFNAATDGKRADRADHARSACAWFANAHHRHAATLTAPGHATMLSGSYPYRNGIIANEWVDRTTFEQVYNTGDPEHKYIGDETRKLDGTSPVRMRGRASSSAAPTTPCDAELVYPNGLSQRPSTVISSLELGACASAAAGTSAAARTDRASLATWVLCCVLATIASGIRHRHRNLQPIT